MNMIFAKSRFNLAAAALAATIFTLASVPSFAGDVTLSGAQEVPPVTTSASGKGMINVGADMSVSGSITVTGVAATAAHIHEAAAGKNGPVIVPLTKADSVFSVPAGAKLTPAQFESYKAGNLYVNVHSEANKGGEIRAQLKP
jgi:hypothetical protein